MRGVWFADLASRLRNFAVSKPRRMSGDSSIEHLRGERTYGSIPKNQSDKIMREDRFALCLSGSASCSTSRTGEKFQCVCVGKSSRIEKSLKKLLPDGENPLVSPSLAAPGLQGSRSQPRHESDVLPFREEW